MSQKEPTTLALYDEEGLFLQWPKLLEKLSLGDGLQYFLEWKAQLFDFVEICGLQFHEFPMEEYLECHLFEVLMDQDLNFETFVQELHEIFQEFNDEEDEEAKDSANAYVADHAQSDWNLETSNLEEEKKPEIRNILEAEIEEEIDVEAQNQTKVVSGYLANDDGTNEAHKVIAIIQASQSQGSFQNNHKEVNNRISHADSYGHTMAPYESHSNPTFTADQNPTVNRISHAGSCGHTMAPHEPHSNPKVRVEKAMEDFRKISKPAGGHNTKLFPRKGGGDGDAQHVVDILSDPRDLVSDTKQVPDVDFILDPGGLNPNSKSYNSNSKSYGGCGGGRSRSCGALKVRRQGNISNQKCQRRYRANRGRFRANRSRFRGTIKDNGARVPKEKPKLVEGHFVPVVLPE